MTDCTVTAKLNEWAVKEPPEGCTGWPPEMIAEDVVASLDETLLAWLRAIKPDPKVFDSDFSQGVIRGFEIVIAQVEQGYHRAALTGKDD